MRGQVLEGRKAIRALVFLLTLVGLVGFASLPAEAAGSAPVITAVNVSWNQGTAQVTLQGQNFTQNALVDFLPVGSSSIRPLSVQTTLLDGMYSLQANLGQWPEWIVYIWTGYGRSSSWTLNEGQSTSQPTSSPASGEFPSSNQNTAPASSSGSSGGTTAGLSPVILGSSVQFGVGTGGSDIVTLSGQNFAPGATVVFLPIAGSAVSATPTFVSSTRLVVDATLSQSQTVYAVNPGGSSSPQYTLYGLGSAPSSSELSSNSSNTQISPPTLPLNESDSTPAIVGSSTFQGNVTGTTVSHSNRLVDAANAAWNATQLGENYITQLPAFSSIYRAYSAAGAATIYANPRSWLSQPGVGGQCQFFVALLLNTAMGTRNQVLNWRTVTENPYYMGLAQVWPDGTWQYGATNVQQGDILLSTTPYPTYSPHAAIVVGVSTDPASITVIDSNWNNDEIIREHTFSGQQVAEFFANRAIGILRYPLNY